MNDANPDWRWIDHRGAINAASETELGELLRTGATAPEALVWRTGWADWMPARRVPQFSAALGSYAGPPRLPEIDGRREPPMPPSRIGTKRASAAESRARSIPALRSLPEALGRRGRQPMPTIDEEMLKPSGSGTLRPPVAVPPPPRAVPPSGTELLPGQVTESVHIVTPIDDLLLSAMADEKPETTPEPPEQQPRPRSEPLVRPPSRAPVPPAVGTSAGLADPAAAAMLRRLLIAVGAVSLLAGILACVAIVLVLTGGFRAGSTPAAVPSQPLPSALVSSVPTAANGCRLLTRPERLAGPVEPTVPALLAAAADGKTIAIGFARGPKQTGELTFELEAMRPFLRPTGPRQERVLGVVPFWRSGGLDFIVDSNRSPLGSPRSLAPDLALGTTKTGLSRTLAKGETRELWPLPEGARITTPSAALIPGKGYGVTFRHGGQSGKIHFGWLGMNGDRASSLGTMQETGLVGTPTLARSGGRGLIAFAARPAERDPWAIRLATMDFGELPERSRPFSLPAGGPGLEAISPSAVGLPHGSWLLQWTEGATGNRQVRVQSLGPDLVPLGAPLTLSPAELNAGQGAALSLGGRVLVVFVTLASGNRELWGVTIQCLS